MKCRQCNASIAFGVPVCPHCRAEQDHFLGRSLGQYRLTQRVGKGAYGWVYAALNEKNQKVAVKVLRAEHSNQDPEQNSLIQRFQQEAKLIQRLEHPDAVKIFETGETGDGLFWIAMEFLEGETLHSLLQKRVRLPAPECMSLLNAVFEVLHEAHQKNIIHRDLKPENLMVLTNGKTKILDFGISKAVELETITQTGAALGTPAYMPKEQWEGSKFITPSADIYSLGLILYKALSGRFPFEATTAAAWMNRHCMVAPKPLRESLEGCSAALDKVVLRSLEKDPSKRYQDALSFRDDLHKALRDEPFEALPMSEPEIILEDKVSDTSTKIPQVQTSKPRAASSSWWIVAGVAIASLVGVFLYVSSSSTPVTPAKLSASTSMAVVSSAPVSAPSLPATTMAATAPASIPQSMPSPEELLMQQIEVKVSDKKWAEAASLAKKAKKPELVEQYQREDKSQKALAKCQKIMQKKKIIIDDAMKACSQIEEGTKAYEEGTELITTVSADFKKKHFANAKTAISKQNLPWSRKEMKLLEPFVKDRDVAALQLKYFALEQECAKRVFRTCK
jgi:serine/threonine protein kinase